MRKFVTALLCLAMILTLFTACGKKNNTAPATTEPPETTTETTTAETTTETTTEETTTEEAKATVEGKYVAKGQAEYGITEENYNQLEFKNGKVIVQMNFLDAVGAFETDYVFDEKNGCVILGAGKGPNGNLIFSAGVKLIPDEYWNTLKIQDMEKHFAVEGYNCPEFFLDGVEFEKTQ